MILYQLLKHTHTQYFALCNFFLIKIVNNFCISFKITESKMTLKKKKGEGKPTWCGNHISRISFFFFYWWTISRISDPGTKGHTYLKWLRWARGFLVHPLKHIFSVFKQYYMYFYTFFHPHVFPHMFSNNKTHIFKHIYQTSPIHLGSAL